MARPGHEVLSRTFAELGAAVMLARASARREPPATGAVVLTDREVEVLRLVADGLSSAQVADTLTLSPHGAPAGIWDRRGDGLD